MDSVVSEVDLQTIRQTALNYIQGWYEGNEEQMGNSLHEILSKRSIRVDDATNQEELWHLTKPELVQFTANGGGKATSREKLIYDITILDSFKGIATVKVLAYDFVDYLHIAKLNGEWKIVNALWANR